MSLAAFHQQFSWISIGPSKCPIVKMISLQVHLTVPAIPWVQHDMTWLLQDQFFEVNEFPNQALKKSQCVLDKASLLFQTVR